jgi:hypothetical protein
MTQPSRDPFLHLEDQLFGGEFARGLGRRVIALHHRHDEFQMHVQA